MIKFLRAVWRQCQAAKLALLQIPMVFLIMILAFIGSGACAKDQTDDKKDAKKDGKGDEAAPAFNPFAKNKYIQPYPPDKFGYNIDNTKLVYKGTYSFETKFNDKLSVKQEGEDLFIDFWFRNPQAIEVQTGSRHGIGTLNEELKLLQVNPKDNKEKIKRIESTIKILKASLRKVDKFDGFRYQFRHPTKYYIIRDNTETDATKALYETATLGYTHNMQETQIDETGLLTEEGAILVARDENKDNRIGSTGNSIAWWNQIFNHWWKLEEFPVLPPDIDYIRARRYFLVEYVQADWDVVYDQARREKSMDPVEAFCRQWYGKALKEMFPNLPDYSWKTVKAVVDAIKQAIKKEDDVYRDWVRNEYKDKYLSKENLYAGKKGTRHLESEAIAVNDKGVLSYQNNDCEFIDKENVEVAGLDGKPVKYLNTLHFRRTVSLDSLNMPALDVSVKKWQEDIWFDAQKNLTVKHEFVVDFGAHFTRQMQDGKGGNETIREFYDSTLRFTLGLVEKSMAGDKSSRSKELTTLKNIVDSYNHATGPEYKSVLDRLEKFKADYAGKTKNYEFNVPIDILSKQCANMVAIFSQYKGFKKYQQINPDEDFCTYVPEDFNPAEKYGLIVYLPDENDNMEARVKEWSSFLLGKKLIVLGFRPQANKYSHMFGQTSSNLYNIIRSIGSTYNIDPKRRYMIGTGKGAQMVLSMAAYSLSDFDRFPLYIPVSNGYLPFNDDCRTIINGAQGQSFQQALFSTSYIFLNPKNASGQATGNAPDACNALGGGFANARAKTPNFPHYAIRLNHDSNEVYNKDVAAFILNQIIPRFESGSKEFFEGLIKNNPGAAPAPEGQKK